MPDLPYGTVTFLFTDIEGSTKRWELHSQAMKSAVESHDVILRKAIQDHGGYVFRTEGDAFRAVFTFAPQALQAALQAQRAIAAEPWPLVIAPMRVRMALHTGAVEIRDGDYVGPSLNRMARLLSAAHGGQTLLSLPSEELVRDSLPPDIALRDLGEHRLKDLIRPEHIYQLVVPGLPSDFPPLITLDAHPNNLPVQPATLVGREKELAQIEKLLAGDRVRVLTLTGPGGTGKTRLALQLGAEVAGSDRYPDGVWFVNLAPITDPNLVVSTIAQTLGVREAAGEPLSHTLASYMKNKRLLMMLDNFEQVVEAAPDIARLMSASLTAGLKTLITSRMPLRISGEHEYPVPPLSLPDTRPGSLPGLEILTRYGAVKLFIERAQSAKPDFDVTNENARAVAEICSKLDGLPLAIELAAARIKMLPPQAMLSRLQSMQSTLKMLTGGRRDLPARQQTLRNTIEWSYNLLDEEEQQLFRRMAVLDGSWTLEVLEAVCNSEALQVEGRPKIDVFDGVQSLIDKSLLQQREGSDGEPRFWMLGTIHEYAREKLAEAASSNGRELEVLEREQALYCMKLVEEAEPHLTGRQQAEWYNRLEEERDNVRAALKWASDRAGADKANGVSGGGDTDNWAEVGLRIAGAIWRFWYIRGPITEGREHLERALSISEASETTLPGRSLSRAKALNGAGALAVRQGDYSSARSLTEAALMLGREVGDKESMALSLNTLGTVALEQGDYPAAYSLYEESLALRRELGNKRGISFSLNTLGTIAYEHQDYPAARALFEESLALSRELEDTWGISFSLGNLGNVALGQGNYQEARSLYEKTLAVRRVLKNTSGIAACLTGLGGVAVGEGQAARGARLIGAAEGLLEPIGTVLDRQERVPYERSVQQARSRLGEHAFEQARLQGRAMSIEEAVAYALEERDHD